MTRASRVLILVLACSLSLVPGLRAQNESRLHAEFRKEVGQCNGLSGCVETLFTGQPLHIAVGSLAPQNGFGAGLAFVEHWHPETCPWWINFTPQPAAGKKTSCRWRSNLNLDAVATPNASWRAGGYFKAYRLPGGSTPRSAPVVNLAAEADSLNLIYYYGLGPNTLPAGQAAFGMTETIVGTNTIIPVAGKANLSFIGELNGRFPQLRGNHSKSSPSIEQLYTEATAPGITSQPAFFQATEGIRLRPAIFAEYLRLNYLFQFQQFVAPSNSHYSFRRWTTDFNHEIPFYRKVRMTAANDQNGPDSCSISSNDTSCPRAFSYTQNNEGSINLRVLMTGSVANAGSVVPFYFDPTIGGSDINGTAMLASYPDYRFRGPDLILFRESVEHSLGKLPIGVAFSADQGKIGLRRDDINLDNLRFTYSAGFTVRAGGLPVLYLLFAWGGNEGHHITAAVSPTLLGGSARPSLF
jgi:hypothetical protein